MEIISLENAQKIYKCKKHNVTALNRISLTVQSGEFLAVTGASGSGKTTLMNVIGFLDSLTKGEYRFLGESTSGLSEGKKHRLRAENVGFVFQNFNLISSLSALHNVMLPLLYRGVPRSKSKAAALDALKRVGLCDRAGHLPCRLSGGQQQRVAIARAIVSSPALILADEPTGNLDPDTSEEIMDLLCSLHQKGHTVVMITHNLTLAQKADRVIKMNDGKMV